LVSVASLLPKIDVENEIKLIEQSMHNQHDLRSLNTMQYLQTPTNYWNQIENFSFPNVSVVIELQILIQGPQRWCYKMLTLKTFPKLHLS